MVAPRQLQRLDLTEPARPHSFCNWEHMPSSKVGDGPEPSSPELAQHQRPCSFRAVVQVVLALQRLSGEQRVREVTAIHLQSRRDASSIPLKSSVSCPASVLLSDAFAGNSFSPSQCY